MELITTRIVGNLMKICFILEKKYIVYSKWFGRSFSELKVSKNIKDSIKLILYENNITKIEKQLSELYIKIIHLHNSKKDLPILKNEIRNFYGRPFSVIMAEDIVSELVNSITNEEVKNMQLEKIAIDLKIDSEDHRDSKLLHEIIS